MTDSLDVNALAEDLMAAQRAALAKTLDDLNQLIRELELSAAGEASNADVIGDLDLDTDDPVYAVVAELIEKNRLVRSQRAATSLELVEVRARTEELARESRALGERFATARQVALFPQNRTLRLSQ